MKYFSVATLFFLLTLLFTMHPGFSFNDGSRHDNIIRPNEQDITSVTDFDGNKYAIIKIGRQTWMASNLTTKHYNNGEEIPEATTIKEWKEYCSEKLGCWCYYENDTELGATYGKLYNSYAADNRNDIAPLGWHVVKMGEIAELSLLLGDSTLGRDSLGLKFKSASGWINLPRNKEEKSNPNGDNVSGLNVLPGGYFSSKGVFNGLETNARFWTITEKGSSDPVIGACLSSGTTGLYWDVLTPYVGSSPWMGYSIRCVKDTVAEN